jgi:amino acid permease
VLVLGIGLGPVIVKKELAELEWLSILLGVSILIFVVLSLVCLFFIPDFPKATNPFDAAIWPEGKWSTISSLCTIMVAYAYQQNVFPVYDALKDQSIAGYKAASTLGLLFSIVVYFLVAMIGVALFGSALSSSVLFNFGEVSNSNGNPFWESTIIQISFMIVLLCHIPFIFYGGKEGLCIIVDEAQRKSISNVLWHKLQANESFARATQTESAPNPELKIPFEAAFEDQV